MKRAGRLDRRDLLRTAVAGGSTAFARLCAAGSRPPALNRRPNILWITCEDISPNLGCYGDSYARSPVLDRLAGEGVRYTNAFGVTGVCAPNRSCLITGVYPSSLGSQGMRSNTPLPDFIKCFSEYLREAGYYCTNNSKTDYNFPTPEAAWDQCDNKAHYRHHKAHRPFFAVFNYTLTHESRIRQPDKSFANVTSMLTDAQRHDPADVPVPPFHPDTPEVRRDWARYHDLITALDYRVGERLAELDEAGLADETIVFFFSDHGAGMPGCKKWVWQSGLHVPLIVRFGDQFSKWRDGAKGGVCDRLVSFVDFAPTVLSLAGVTIPEHMQGVAFLGEQAGKPRKYVYAHRDRMAERFDMVRVVRDRRFQYMRNFMPHRTWSQFTEYTEQMPTMKIWRKLADQGALAGPAARYFSKTKPIEELYETATDPHQIHNLAADPKYADVLQRMRTECAGWMQRTGDLGLLPEFELHQRASESTPWQIGRDARRNPVKRLLKAADIANAMEVGNLRLLIELVKEDDPAIRWWGAVGLVALGDRAAPATDALAGALSDESPNVRIEAAEAMCNIGQTETAMPVLIEALQHDSPFIRLRAISVLDRLGDVAKPAIPHIRKAGMTSKEHSQVASYLGQMTRYVGR